MPAFTTHYLFGVRMYHELTDQKIKKMLKRNLGPFRFGMQGPDLFFYNPYYFFRPQERNVGRLMHESNVNLFFRNYLDQVSHLSKKEDREAALAYFYGFLCHYALDTKLHPYVYYRSGYHVTKNNDKKESFSMHTYIEALMDTIILKETLGLNPSQFHQSRTLTLSKREYHLLSNLLVHAVNKTYFPPMDLLSKVSHKLDKKSHCESRRSFVRQLLFWNTQKECIEQALEKKITLFFSILSIKLGTWLLHDKIGLKKKLIHFIEEHFVKEVIVGHIIENDFSTDTIDANNKNHNAWHNPWDTTQHSHASVTELFEEAVLFYLSFEKSLHACAHALLSPKDRKKIHKNTELLLTKLGNLSYHSGLPCDKE